MHIGGPPLSNAIKLSATEAPQALGKLEWQSSEDALRLEERVTPRHIFHEMRGW